MKNFMLFLSAYFCFLSAYAQVDPVKDDPLRINRPTTSQRGEVSQKIGVNFIKVNYGRPNVKGRKVFDGLLKYGKVWRVGADNQTILELQGDYNIAGKGIPQGKYALYAIPAQDQWKIYLNKDVNGWGQYSYKEKLNVFEFDVPVEKAPEFTETFTIGFMNASLNKGVLYIQWENIRVKLPVEVSARDKKRMERTLDYVTSEKARAYNIYLLSEYYFLEKKDYPKALKLIRTSIEKGIKAFYTHYLEGEILFAMGKKKEALQAAKKAEKLSNEKNPEWYWKIKKAIKDWSK